MKVAFVTANYPPEALGGTEQVTSALARELRELGVDVFVISGSDERHDGVDVHEERHEGVQVLRLAKRADEWGDGVFVRPRLCALVHDLLERQRPDVVHVHAFSNLGAGLTPIARALGMRAIASFHDLWLTCARYFRVPHGGVTCPTGVDRTPCVTCLNVWLDTEPEVVRAGLAERDRVLRAELQLVDRAIAPSDTAARYVRECLPFAGRIDVVPHGLLRAVPAAHLAPRPVDGAPLRVGTWGGVVREKGIAELMAAVRGLDCELHVAGPAYDDEFEHELRRQAEQQGTRFVRRGRFTAAERHPARDLHLAVFPSKCQETYGLVVDEALAHGVPVVCSDAGALAERATVPGVVVTPLASLSETLAELVGSRQRLAALRAAIPAALPTIRASAERHLEIYRRLR